MTMTVHKLPEEYLEIMKTDNLLDLFHIFLRMRRHIAAVLIARADREFRLRHIHGDRLPEILSNLLSQNTGTTIPVKTDVSETRISAESAP